MTRRRARSALQLARSCGVPGCSVAIVDVNDLGRVKVLASSAGCDEELLHRALRPNPAGNAMSALPWYWFDPSESQQTKVSDTL